MNTSIFDRRTSGNAAPEYRLFADGNALRVEPVTAPSWSPRIVESTESPTEIHTGAVKVRAEVRAKRFHGNRVNDDRFEATITATDSSPASILLALSRALQSAEELNSSDSTEERLVLQVSLVR